METIAPVRLSSTAPWNERLGNPYRTRWAEHHGLKFKVFAQYLRGAYYVEEVNDEGETIAFITVALTHEEARQVVAAWKAEGDA